MRCWYLRSCIGWYDRRGGGQQSVYGVWLQNFRESLSEKKNNLNMQHALTQKLYMIVCIMCAVVFRLLYVWSSPTHQKVLYVWVQKYFVKNIHLENCVLILVYTRIEDVCKVFALFGNRILYILWLYWRRFAHAELSTIEVMRFRTLLRKSYMCGSYYHHIRAKYSNISIYTQTFVV